jgi:hypothetical protein
VSFALAHRGGSCRHAGGAYDRRGRRQLQRVVADVVLVHAHDVGRRQALRARRRACRLRQIIERRRQRQRHRRQVGDGERDAVSVDVDHERRDVDNDGDDESAGRWWSVVERLQYRHHRHQVSTFCVMHDECVQKKNNVELLLIRLQRCCCRARQQDQRSVCNRCLSACDCVIWHWYQRNENNNVVVG